MEWHNKEFQLFMCFFNYLKYFSHLHNAGSKSVTLLWADSATRRSSTAPLLLVNTLELKALCKPWTSVVTHTLPGFRHHHLSWEKACTSLSQTHFSNVHLSTSLGSITSDHNFSSSSQASSYSCIPEQGCISSKVHPFQVHSPISGPLSSQLSQLMTNHVNSEFV